MKSARTIATRATALAIIAGTGFTPLLVPVAAFADTTSTQPAANTNDKNGYRAQFIVDKTRTFDYDGIHKTITCLSANYPKEVEFIQSSPGIQQTRAANVRIVPATDTTTTIDGRTIKGKTYTVSLYDGNKLTLNCYKAGDFFANLKITWNGVQATDFNPYGPDGVGEDADKSSYSSGTATINTSFTNAELKKLADNGADLDIHVEGIPTGWTAKNNPANGESNNVGPGNVATKDANSDAFTEITTYEYTNPEYPGNTYRLVITNINTAPQPTIQATDTPAPADTPQLVQTSVEQTGAAAALFVSTAIAAHAIARRKRK